VHKRQETRASGMFLCSCFTGPVGIVCERSVVVVEDNSQETRASGMFLCSCFTGPVGIVCERSVVVVEDNSQDKSKCSYILVLHHSRQEACVLAWTCTKKQSFLKKQANKF
jgi:hypothetical protein